LREIREILKYFLGEIERMENDVNEIYTEVMKSA